MTAPHPIVPPQLPATDAEARAWIAAVDARTAHHGVMVDGARVVFRRVGEGPPLVLLHGGHGCWLHWVRNLDALAHTRTLWLADMPSYGDSDTLADPPTLDRLAAAVATAIDGLPGLRGVPVDIAGFSFGGLVAAHAAALRPAVRSLACIGVASHGQPRREMPAMQDWKAIDDPAERDARLRYNLSALMLHDPVRIDALALAIHRSACERTRFRSAGFARRPLLQPALDRLSARGVPVLLAWGAHDVTGDPAVVGPLLAPTGTHRRWAVLPGAGHWVQYENPEPLHALLRPWLDAPTA